MTKDILADVIHKSPNRRSFVRKLGIASAAVGVASVLKPSNLEAQSASLSDADILNFALNLEFLEAEFYTVATSGRTIDYLGIDNTGSGNSGLTTGGSQVNFTNAIIRNVAQELAADERTHVALLQNAILSLGATPIAKPAINLNALGFGFGNQNDFLRLARIFEDIGVTAYGGAAPLITSKTVLGIAARILATEALHAGNIRLLIAQNGIPTTPLDGADILPSPSGIQYFTTNSNALTEVRTPGQVLLLAYNASSASSGGFFPSGVNGNSSLLMSSATQASIDTSTLVASPNPIILQGAPYGTTTIYWNCPSSVQYIQIRVGSPTGPLFTTNTGTGSMRTGAWVTDGQVFFLQDITNGKAVIADNTLATLIVHTI